MLDQADERKKEEVQKCRIVWIGITIFYLRFVPRYQSNFDVNTMYIGVNVMFLSNNI